jgi:YD repeat-containing protein
MLRLALAGTVLAAALLAAISTAHSIGNETINYTYDAQGRLTNVIHAGSVNNSLQANYTYDKTNNRVTVNVTGAP